MHRRGSGWRRLTMVFWRPSILVAVSTRYRWCNAVDDGHVGDSVDRVKPKESTRLQRERNLEADPRATLLVDHWDPVDWAQLWWVRTELRRVDSAERAGRLGELFEERYPQYTGQPFEKVLVLRIERVTGWQASESVAIPASPPDPANSVGEAGSRRGVQEGLSRCSGD